MLVNASAVGFYGPRTDAPVDESEPSGTDFLAQLCRDWEAAAQSASAGVRVAIVRIGVILGTEDGALKRMLLPFKLGLGGPLGSGRQVFPWVHVDDLARLFVMLVENDSARGVFNGTAPNALTMKEFAATLGKVLKRPAFFAAPAPAIKLALGEVASVLLTGQRAVPKRALEHGFEFRFPEAEGALRDLLGR